jgi:hypothetical protein
LVENKEAINIQQSAFGLLRNTFQLRELPELPTLVIGKFPGIGRSGDPRAIGSAIAN